MDDNDSTSGKRSGPAGQSTVPQGPLQAESGVTGHSAASEGAATPPKSSAMSNATVLGAPLEDVLQSSSASAPKLPITGNQTSFAAPVGAIVKTVTEIPQGIVKTVAEIPPGIVKTVTEIPPGIVKTVTEIPQGIASNPSIAPPPSRAKPAENVPTLPILLGAGAMVAGVALFAIVWGSGKNTVDNPPLPQASAAIVNDSLNRWIHVEGASGKVLGTGDNDLPPSVRGLRPSQQVLAPLAAFDIQQHEVSWSELDPWLDKNAAFAFPKQTTGLTSTDAQKSLPAYGVPWNTALAYCRAMGATLPTEEQWEIAARGSGMKRFPWGNAAPDWSRVHSFKGDMAGPAKIMSNEQDRTEGPADKAIYDLAGNVQEWTFSVWRDDFPDRDESWVQADGTTAYTLRGLPLHRDVPGRIDELSVAYRDWMCATGDCSPLASGASAKERARTPKLELWAGADSTQPSALAWRRIIEKSEVISAVTRCFSAPTSTTLTIKAAKENVCQRSGQLPSNGTCDGQPALSGTLARVAGGLPEPIQKCVNYALHDASVKNIALNLPETQFSYAMYVSINPQEALRHVGFRCVRETSTP